MGYRHLITHWPTRVCARNRAHADLTKRHSSLVRHLILLIIIIFLSVICSVWEHANRLSLGFVVFGQRDLSVSGIKIVCRPIHERALQIILGLGYLNYYHALIKCNLIPLRDRRKDVCFNFAKTLRESDVFRHWLPQSRGYNVQYQLRNSKQSFSNSPMPYFVSILNQKIIRCSSYSANTSLILFGFF